MSRFTGDGWIPCPSGYTRGQGWGLLHKAWIGFKRANNPRNEESLQDKLYWASMIQVIQTDLGIARSSFPQLSLLGDLVFLYNKEKELELQEQYDELWYIDYLDRGHCVPGCRFYEPTGRLTVFDILEDYRGYQKFEEVLQAYKELESNGVLATE